MNDILDGFYVTGPNSSSNSYVSISGNFGLYAGAGVSIGPLSGSLTFNGGLNANVNLYLDDADPDSSNDGKIRISEINAELQEGQPVFEASGSVTAALTLVASGSIGPFHASDTLATFASATL